jgi:pSer/pThr/pTyr-binding forkhead associated (FHA) protein
MTEILPSSLVVEKGECDTNIVLLEKTPHVLGKLPHADTGFESEFVSRLHAEVFEEEGYYKVRDLGSKNGTSVNGKKVVEQGQMLHHGDGIELAEGQVILCFNPSGRTLTLGLGTIPTKQGSSSRR